MKNKLLVLVLLFSQLSLFSQEYETIVDTSKQWNVVYTMINPCAPPWENQYSTTYVYTLGEEVEIEGVLYYKVIQDGNFTNNYIREDAQHKVYFIGEGEEYLLYDFDVEVGDIVYGAYNQAWTITAVETEYYAGADRKKISLDGAGEDIWYEGRGSIRGLTFSLYECIDCYTNLLCYSQNDEIILGAEGNCNYSSSPNYDISFFMDHHFIFSHFLLDGETIEDSAGEFDATFTSDSASGAFEHFNPSYMGMCGNSTSAFVFLNDNNTFTVESRGVTTLAQCNPYEYPLGDGQEEKYFNILTGYIDDFPDNPLPVYYQKLEGNNILHMWTDENEKLVFDTYALGIANYSIKDQFSFYPNPVNSIFTVSTTLTNYRIEISNILGKKIKEQQATTSATQLNLSDLTNGVYFVTITAGAESFTIKLVKD